METLEHYGIVCALRIIMLELNLPQELPYFGFISADLPFFFRPKMHQMPHLEIEPALLQLPIADRAVAIEYCSGNGHWIIEQAKKRPDIFWFAIEKRLSRARKILSKVLFEKLSNVYVVCSEAHWFTQYYIPQASVEMVFVNFPDPWPKNKHSHHRLFTETFIAQLERILIPAGSLHLVTDERIYIQKAIELFLLSPKFQSALTTMNHCQLISLNEWGYSFFAQLWHNKGKDLYRTQFIRTSL